MLVASTRKSPYWNGLGARAVLDHQVELEETLLPADSKTPNWDDSGPDSTGCRPPGRRSPLPRRLRSRPRCLRSGTRSSGWSHPRWCSSPVSTSWLCSATVSVSVSLMASTSMARGRGVEQPALASVTRPRSRPRYRARCRCRNPRPGARPGPRSGSRHRTRSG